MAGSPRLDISTVYGDIEERYHGAVQALKRTPLGRSNVIKVDIDRAADSIFYVLPATGEKFTDIGLAHEAANRTFVGEVVNFQPRIGQLSPIDNANRYINRYGTFQNILEDIYGQVTNLDSGKRAILEAAGIDVDALQNLQADIITFSPREGGLKEVAGEIARLQREGPIRGIPIIDPKGSRLIQFRAGETVLEGNQAFLLMALTGHSVSNIDTVMKALEDPMGAGADKLASMFEKQIKRERAFFSARDVSLSGDELDDVLRQFNEDIATTLTEKTLVLDPQYEILKMFSGRRLTGGAKAFYSQKFNLSGAGDALKLTPEDYIRNILEFTKDFKTDENLLNSYMGRLRTAVQAFETDVAPGLNNAWASSKLEEYLQGVFENDETGRTMVNNIFKSIEQAFDGSDLLNKRFLDTYTKHLRTRMRDLEGVIGGTTDDATKKKAKDSIGEIRSLLSRIEDGDLGQITGRGNIFVQQLNQFRNIKNAWDAKSAFAGGLEKYMSIITKFSLKADTSVAGDISSFVMSGLGKLDDLVYADPVAISFMPEAFSSSEAIEAMKNNSTAKLLEMNEVMKSGTIPQKLRKMIDKQAEINIEAIPVNERQAAYRNREFAKEIQRMIQAGANPRDHPLMANLIHHFYAAQAFIERKGRVYPVIPELFRFQIDTERLDVKLGKGFETVSHGVKAYDQSSGQWVSTALANDAKVMQFRISGHKMFIPDHAVGIYHHSLGGFDLDDKGLPRLITYEDNAGMKRLGFYLFRQPSGPEEVVFMRMRMDRETIQSLFNRDYFKEALEQLHGEAIANNIGGRTVDATFAADLDILREALDESSEVFNDSFLFTEPDRLENTIARVWERAATNKKTGVVKLTQKAADKIFGREGKTSRLQVEDLVEEVNGKIQTLSPDYSTRGIYKGFLEEGVFDMSSAMREAVSNFGFDERLKNRLIQISNQADVSTRQADMFRALNDFVQSGTIADLESRKQMVSGFIDYSSSKMRMLAAQNAEGFLGSYVNTSMAVGSTLDQYQSFLGKVSSNVQDYMVENFKIGLLAQETAIDLSTTFSRSKTLFSETARIIAEQAGSISNVQGVATTIARIAGLGTTENIGIEDIRQLAVENLGRSIGASRTIFAAGGIDEDLAMGIDVDLLTDRLNPKDKSRLLNAIILGYEQTMAAITSGNLSLDGSVNQGFIEQMEALKEVRARDIEGEINDMLIANFALQADHKYASVSKVTSIGNRMKAYFEANKKSIIRNLGESPVLSLAETTEVERTLADQIINKNKEMLEEIFSIYTKDANDMANIDLYDHAVRSQALAKRIFDDINLARQMQGVSSQRLFNAIDQSVARIRGTFDILGLTPLINQDTGEFYDENHRDITNMWRVARERRATLHAIALNNARRVGSEQTLAETVLERLRGESDRLSRDIIMERAETILGSETDDNVKNVLLSILERGREISDDMARRQAGAEADIVNALASHEDLDQEIVDTLDLVNDDTAISGEMDDASRRSLDEFERALSAPDSAGTIDGAVYRRFSESKETVKMLLQDNLVRKSALGIGAVILASFAYTSIKDRTHEDMSGPPLLPGGSAYESDYPRYSPQVADLRSQGYSSGMSYNVSVSGSQDQIDRFNQEIGGLTNGDVNTTMYTGAPDVGGSFLDRISSIF